MSKLSNFVIVIVFLILVSVPGIFIVFDRAGCDLPSELGVGRSKTLLEARTIHAFPSPSPDSFMSGSFQKDLDSWLSDNVVFRDESMLLTASIHRTFIAPTATLFRFDVYPTYYGSNILNGGGFLASYPIKQSERIDRSLDAALCSFNDLFKKHPDITFHLMIPMTPYNPSVVGDLVSDSVDVSYLESHFYSQLAENCIVLNQPVTNYDDVKDQYFKNDHHWNNVGAQKGYETIATSLGFGDELLEPETVRSYPVEYWGSRAREGLDLSLGPDSFDVFAYNLPSVTVKVNQELVDDPSSFLESNRLYDAGAWSDDRFFNYYSDYYHVDANLLETKRHDASDRGALLIIGDSFASRIEELFTVHYDKVYRIDPRFKSWTIDSFLDNHPDVHDAVILLILTDVLDERVSERFQLQDNGS